MTCWPCSKANPVTTGVIKHKKVDFYTVKVRLKSVQIKLSKFENVGKASVNDRVYQTDKRKDKEIS